MSDETTSKPRSAQGTRLNKRGMASRQAFIETAVDTLAAEGPAGVSANLVAKRAGVTWGTIQHQFGDADGVWAALVDELHDRVLRVDAAPTRGRASLRRRVQSLVEVVWQGSGSREVRAVQSLRLALPRSPDALHAEYPRTEAALRKLDAGWETLWTELFSDLPVSRTRLRRMQSLIPGAVSGLRLEADMVTYADPEEGLRGLIDAVVAYLEADGG